jgi:hypothetical protein
MATPRPVWVNPRVKIFFRWPESVKLLKNCGAYVKWKSSATRELSVTPL